MIDKHDEIKSWYNGYLFGEANIYNPRSLIRYIKDHLESRNKYAESYWANTSSNSIVRKLIEMADEALKQIDIRQYTKEIEDDGYETVYKYGIAFCGKDCMIK